MNEILSLGIIFILGLIAQKLIQRVKIPIVTGYLLLGILIGPYILNVVSPRILRFSGLFSEIVLGIIAFSIGENFSIANLKTIGRTVFLISVGEVALAFLAVSMVLHFLLKQSIPIALVFGSIAAATAPAATIMVIREYRAKGPFTSTLLGVVAVDDAWGLILFGVFFSIAKSIACKSNVFIPVVILLALLKILGAFILGGLLGWILSYFSKLIKNRDELLIYTLGFILLSVGFSRLLDFSVLLTCLGLGTASINFAQRGRKFFDIVDSVSSPLFLLFFILVGAELELPALARLGWVGAAYLVSRVFGKWIGAYIGAKFTRAPDLIKKYIGLGLVPQAGVALGMALYVKSYFVEAGATILPVIIGCTVIYELVGPLCTKYALTKVYEIEK